MGNMNGMGHMAGMGIGGVARGMMGLGGMGMAPGYGMPVSMGNNVQFMTQVPCQGSQTMGNTYHMNVGTTAPQQSSAAPCKQGQK